MTLITDGIQEYTKLERLGCLKKLSKMAEKCSFKRTSKMVKTVIEDFSKTETRFSLAPFEDVYWTTPMHKRKNLKRNNNE